VKASRRTSRWTAIRKRLETFDRAGLLNLIVDLYGADARNRRFLESRLLADPNVIEEYRRSVSAAIYPDPFSRRPISIRDASAAITHYQRATGDPVGVTDLMLSFVEAGTEQAADLGYGDEDYFGALERKLDAIATAYADLPPDVRSTVVRRLQRIRDRAQKIGWGFGDYVDEVVGRIESRVVTRAAPIRRRRR